MFVSLFFLYFYTINKSGYEQQVAKNSGCFFNFNYLFPFFMCCTQFAYLTVVHIAF
jgi:hypothetical protein